VNRPSWPPAAGKEEPAFESTALEVLATSLGMRLTHYELEWLWRALKKQADQEPETDGEAPVLAGYRDACEPVRCSSA
jgi:hypothetical protein